jgi:hypothetical protein
MFGQVRGRQFIAQSAAKGFKKLSREGFTVPEQRWPALRIALRGMDSC